MAIDKRASLISNKTVVVDDSWCAIFYFLIIRIHFLVLYLSNLQHMISNQAEKKTEV